MFGGKKGKVARKKLFSYVTIFLLVGGLLLSVTAGFFDFLWGKKNLASPTVEEDYILNLKKQADFLEETCRENPGNLEERATLGSVYYELAIYYWDQGSEEGKNYAAKSLELLRPSVEGGLREPFITLKIALLAMLIEKDDSLAEKYFRDTLELQNDYPEAHFYYGLLLASQQRVTEAQIHWEEVLQQAEESSPLAQAARSYLQDYVENGNAEDKGEKGKGKTQYVEEN